ncbi:MAG: RNA polymerase sigma factor [Phycisphaerae bacterium]
MTEQELIQRCRDGDADARRALYDRTCARVYGLLLRMTGDVNDARDLTQETYVKTFSHLDQFDGRSAVATWVCRIAVNEALQWGRREARARARLRDAAHAQARDVADEGVRTARRLDVRSALSAVTPMDRAMLLLRYQEGLDYRAIAEVVGCAPGTVASRLNRARRRLQAVLRGSYGAEPASPGGVRPERAAGAAGVVAELGDAAAGADGL